MIYNEERPHGFDAVVGQNMVVESIRKQAIADKFMGVYILYGQYGSGKTTMARIIALAANCPKDAHGNPDLENPVAKAILSGNCMDYMEIDGASNNGIDQVRALIDNAAYKPSFLKKKIYIIDEVHMLSNSAFNALLKTLEEPPEYAIFILCTTEHKAIPATVRSRSACYCFQKISDEDICGKLMAICKKRGISATQEGCMLIAKNSDGALRNAESILEQVAIGKELITEETVRDAIGVADVSYIFSFMAEMMKGNVSGAVNRLDEMLAEGKNLSYLVDDMLDVVSDAIILSCSKSLGNIVNTSYYQKQLQEFTDGVSLTRLVSASDELMKLRSDIRASESRTAMVVAIVSISGAAAAEESLVNELSAKIEDLTERISVLEQGKSCSCVETSAVSVEESVIEEPVKENDIAESSAVSLEGFEKSAKDKPLCEESATVTDAGDNGVALQPEAEIGNPSTEQMELGEWEETSTVPDFDFGAFGVFDSLFNMSADSWSSDANVAMPTPMHEQPNVEQEEPMQVSAEKTEPDKISDKAAGIIERINRVAESDAAFYTAIHNGSRMEVLNDVVTYVTSLMPIKKMLDKYFEVFGLEAIVRVE